MQDKTQRINLSYLRQFVKSEEIIIKWVCSNSQVADVLTKSGGLSYRLKEIVETGQLWLVKHLIEVSVLLFCMLPFISYNVFGNLYWIILLLDLCTYMVLLEWYKKLLVGYVKVWVATHRYR